MRPNASPKMLPRPRSSSMMCPHAHSMNEIAGAEVLKPSIVEGSQSRTPGLTSIPFVL
jgi:hypothetical protein